MENNSKLAPESFSIFSIIESLEKKNNLQREINKLNDERIEIENIIKEVLYHFSSSFLRDYIAEKLVENFPEETKKDYKKYHQENLTLLKSYINKIKDGISSTDKDKYSSQVYSVSNVFDPYFDSWDLVDVEWNNDKTYVRFSVTCHKLEESLSPFDRILSLFWTAWIPVTELKRADWQFKKQTDSLIPKITVLSKTGQNE